MPYTVDFADVSTVGLESSPVADALAGLRANEARYFKNKFDHAFTVDPASEATETVDWVHGDPEGRARPRDLLPPARGHVVRGRRDPDGLRVLRVGAVDQRAVRPRGRAEARGRVQAVRRHGGSRGARARFKFARQKSKLAGTIRGSYFVIKGEH